MPLRLIVFSLVASVLTGGLHYWFWARLVRDPAMPAPYRVVATVALALLALSIPLTMVGRRLLPTLVPQGIARYIAQHKLYQAH